MVASTLGYALMAAGPGIALGWQVLGHSPFLVLVMLASAFVWLAALVVASLLVLPLSPLASLPARLAALATVVGVEAATARGLWHADRRLLAALAAAATSSPGHRPPDGGDAAALAAAHGLAHGLTHALLLYLAWLPVSAGGRTLASPACAGVASLFGGGALAAGAGVALHAGTAPLAFAGWDDGDRRLVAGAGGAHAAFAAASLLNLLPGGGCALGLGAGLAIGVGTLVAAFRVEKARAAAGAWRRPVVVVAAGGGGRSGEQAGVEGG